jgi:hypothetical protein
VRKPPGRSTEERAAEDGREIEPRALDQGIEVLVPAESDDCIRRCLRSLVVVDDADRIIEKQGLGDVDGSLLGEVEQQASQGRRSGFCR